jgi:hypothetical protein
MHSASADAVLHHLILIHTPPLPFAHACHAASDPYLHHMHDLHTHARLLRESGGSPIAHIRQACCTDQQGREEVIPPSPHVHAPHVPHRTRTFVREIVTTAPSRPSSLSPLITLSLARPKPLIFRSPSPLLVPSARSGFQKAPLGSPSVGQPPKTRCRETSNSPLCRRARVHTGRPPALSFKITSLLCTHTR